MDLRQFFNDWGGLISILALLLTVPLALLANLLTPKVQDWLARTSTDRTKNRIRKLEAELQEFTRLANSPAEMQLFLLSRLIESLALLAMGIAMFVVGALLGISSILRAVTEPLPTSALVPFELTGRLFMVTTGLCYTSFILAALRLLDAQRVRKKANNPRHKNKLEQRINDLRARSSL